MFKYLITGATALFLMTSSALSLTYKQWSQDNFGNDLHIQFLADYNANGNGKYINEYFDQVWWPENMPEQNEFQTWASENESAYAEFDAAYLAAKSIPAGTEGSSFGISNSDWWTNVWWPANNPANQSVGVAQIWYDNLSNDKKQNDLYINNSIINSDFNDLTADVQTYIKGLFAELDIEEQNKWVPVELGGVEYWFNSLTAAEKLAKIGITGTNSNIPYSTFVGTWKDNIDAAYANLSETEQANWQTTLTSNDGTGTPDSAYLNNPNNNTVSTYTYVYYGGENNPYIPSEITLTVDLSDEIVQAHQDGWTGKGFTIKGQAKGWAYQSGYFHTPTSKFKQVIKHYELADKAKQDRNQGNYSSWEEGEKLRKKAKYHDNQRRKAEARVGRQTVTAINIHEAKDIAPGATFVAPDALDYTAKLYKTNDAANFVLFDKATHTGDAESKRAVRSYNADEAAKGALVWHKFNTLTKPQFEDLIEKSSSIVPVNGSNSFPSFFKDDIVKMIDLNVALSPVGNIQ